MFRSLRILSAIPRVETLLRNKQYSELSKFLTSTSPEFVITEDEWIKVVDHIVKDQSASPIIIPSLLISTAARDFSLSWEQKNLVSKSFTQSFANMSEFDRIVTTIGASQLGLRTPEVISCVSDFLLSDAESIPEKFLPSILLAMANLAINNQRAWGTLIARVPIESLSLHALSNMALAVATSRSFPISLLERIVDTASLVNLSHATAEDIVTLAHSLTCLELYRTDLFRSLLDKLSRELKLDADASKLVKQILLAVQIDPKATAIVESIAPTVWHRFDKLLDWSIPEPQRIHGTTDGEIQQMLDEEREENDTQSEGISSSLCVPKSMTDWTPDIARTVAMERFYLPDIVDVGGKIFVHVDDETFPDCSEGPIDPYLQVKHMQIAQCGYKLVWIREQEWLNLEDEAEKREWLKSVLK